MYRCSIFLLLLVLLSSFLFAQPAENDKPIITVLDFSTESVSQNEMKTIISLLSSSLFQMNSFTVIDVSQRENILSEIEFSAGGCTDESCMLEIGKLLAAEMIVAGSLSKLGTRYVLSSKLLETQTGKTLGTADGIYADLDAMVDDLNAFGNRLVQSAVTVPEVAETALPPASEAEEGQTIKPEVVKPPKPPREPSVIDWRKTGGISLIAAGAIAAGVGGYFIYDALGPRTEAVDTAWTAYDTAIANFDDFYTAYTTANTERKTFYICGLAAAGGGAALAGLGTALLIIPKKDAAVEVSAAIIPVPRALGACVSLRY